MKWDKPLRQIGISLTTVIICILVATVSNAQQTSVNVLRQGEEVNINGDNLPLSWRQWESNGETHLGITDAATQQRLGLELLSSNNPAQQPVWWFSQDSPYSLDAEQIGANRYLDLSPILRESSEELAVLEDRLEIETTPTQVQDIRIGNQSWGKRIVVDLEKPILWQMREGREQATLKLAAATPSNISEKFAPPPEKIDEEDEEDITPPLLVVKPDGQQTELNINFPESLKLKLSTLANPARLVIDLRPDTLNSRTIRWKQGMQWRQDYIAVNNDQFAVTWLEIDPNRHNLRLTPIWTNQQDMEGIASLSDLGKEFGVTIAINGGFFNRDRQLPLGAIKREGKWHSSPILNRGAIAWDNQGSMMMDRLRYQEALVINGQDRISLQALNSGYVQSGVARYTPAWGRSYTPLNSEETVVLVENNRVQRVTKATQGESISIPPNGYLLTIRGKPELSSRLREGSSLQLQDQTVPPAFGNYPHILAAGPLLIKNQQVVLDAKGENFSDAFIRQKAHRSAIALQEDGKLLLVAMGERIGGNGPTLKESVSILQRLGAIDALNLDGGSSTSLYLGGELINRPAATAARIHSAIGLYLED
ncbi:MAG: phosphodiester glycosidase family protein [Halothece sp.]